MGALRRPRTQSVRIPGEMEQQLSRNQSLRVLSPCLLLRLRAKTTPAPALTAVGGRGRRRSGETALGGCSKQALPHIMAQTQLKSTSRSHKPKQPLQAREKLSSNMLAGLKALSTLFPSFHRHFQMWFLGWPFSSTSSQQKGKSRRMLCGRGLWTPFSQPPLQLGVVM